jgi:hypothetical protein
MEGEVDANERFYAALMESQGILIITMDMGMSIDTIQYEYMLHARSDELRWYFKTIVYMPVMTAWYELKCFVCFNSRSSVTLAGVR